MILRLRHHDLKPGARAVQVVIDGIDEFFGRVDRLDCLNATHIIANTLIEANRGFQVRVRANSAGKRVSETRVCRRNLIGVSFSLLALFFFGPAFSFNFGRALVENLVDDLATVEELLEVFSALGLILISLGLEIAIVTRVYQTIIRLLIEILLRLAPSGLFIEGARAAATIVLSHLLRALLLTARLRRLLRHGVLAVVLRVAL